MSCLSGTKASQDTMSMSVSLMMVSPIGTGHITSCIGHVTSCIGHVTSCAGHVTLCASHVTLCWSCDMCCSCGMY